MLSYFSKIHAMKAKKKILAMLLSVFVFMAMHDFIIGYIDTDTQAEVYIHNVENVSVCQASVFHEHIHQVLMLFDALPKEPIIVPDNLSSADISENQHFASSLHQHRLDRPPIL